MFLPGDRWFREARQVPRAGGFDDGVGARSHIHDLREEMGIAQVTVFLERIEPDLTNSRKTAPQVGQAVGSLSFPCSL
ncbi:MAG TPA: hypothetical protein VES92_08090 [Nitrospiraceae bacterium]|nr:hypothetical protein [Nitrospiraceae bacterium]